MEERHEFLNMKAEAAAQFLGEQGFNVWVVNLYGSQNYNMDYEGSDYDFKAIILPSLDDIINNKQPISHVYDLPLGDGQVDVKDVRLMFDNYRKQNANFMETLFTEFYWVNPAYTEAWQEIRDLAERVAYADMSRAINAMIGMSMEKCHALCHPYESKVELLKERGYDAKQLSHELRLYYMMKKFAAKVPYRELLVPNEEELELLMNYKLYKPQLDVATAKYIADEIVEEMQDYRELLFAENQYPVDEEAYELLDAIKTRVMKDAFVAELATEAWEKYQEIANGGR